MQLERGRARQAGWTECRRLRYGFRAVGRLGSGEAGGAAELGRVRHMACPARHRRSRSQYVLPSRRSSRSGRRSDPWPNGLAEVGNRSRRWRNGPMPAWRPTHCAPHAGCSIAPESHQTRAVIHLEDRHLPRDGRLREPALLRHGGERERLGGAHERLRGQHPSSCSAMCAACSVGQLGPAAAVTATVAVRPSTKSTFAGKSSSLTRTGTRCAKRTQLKVGLTLASRSGLSERSRSAMPAAMLTTCPLSVCCSPISRTCTRSPIWMRGSFVSSKYPSTRRVALSMSAITPLPTVT